MSTVAVEASSKSTRASCSKNGAAKAKRASDSPCPRIGADTSPKLDVPQAPALVTKQEQVLTFLNPPDGASIKEIMQATDWQQHSVRGFLAGTVKKTLGFTLTSSKDPGEARRYRVVTRRGR